MQNDKNGPRVYVEWRQFNYLMKFVENTLRAAALKL